MDDTPERVIVYACVTNIPGDPQRRHNTLGEMLCKQVFGREFQLKLQPPRYDHVHIPGDFDSDKPVKRWFIFDLNVKQQLDTKAVTQLPHSVFLASWQDGELYAYCMIPPEVDANILVGFSYNARNGGRE